MASEVELSRFLRARRAQLSPEAVGLAPHQGVRHVAGLRREEVALLAGVSVDYYARLEQGRPVNYSRAVLEAVARALQLDDDTHGYFLDLVHRRSPRPTTVTVDDGVRPGFARILRSLDQNPAIVLNWRNDVLAANLLARELFDDFDEASSGCDRNFARFVYFGASARQLFVPWEETAQITAGTLRRQLGRHPDDEPLKLLVQELQADPFFARCWRDHDVTEPRHSTKLYRHPHVGELTLDCDTVYLPNDVDQVLVIHTAVPGSPAEQTLSALADRAEHRAPELPRG